jgi:5-methylcytosine-specific restriction endonuclease McrA
LVTGVASPVDVDYEPGEGDEEWNFDEPVSMYTRTWEEWITRPIRDYEFSVRTVNMEIRVPYAVVCANYAAVPIKRVLFPSNRNIWERDNNVCGYTGIKLSKADCSVDHILPQSTHRELKHSWSNLVTCHRELNSWKGDRLLNECNLLEFNPSCPKLAEWVKTSIARGLTTLVLNHKPKKPAGGIILTDILPQWKSFVM